MKIKRLRHFKIVTYKLTDLDIVDGCSLRWGGGRVTRFQKGEDKNWVKGRENFPRSPAVTGVNTIPELIFEVIWKKTVRLSSCSGNGVGHTWEDLGRC